MVTLVIYLSLFIESAPVYSTKLPFYFISDGRCLARSKLIISINDAKTIEIVRLKMITPITSLQNAMVSFS